MYQECEWWSSALLNTGSDNVRCRMGACIWWFWSPLMLLDAHLPRKQDQDKWGWGKFSLRTHYPTWPEEWNLVPLLRMVNLLILLPGFHSFQDQSWVLRHRWPIYPCSLNAVEVHGSGRIVWSTRVSRRLNFTAWHQHEIGSGVRIIKSQENFT